MIPHMQALAFIGDASDATKQDFPVSGEYKRSASKNGRTVGWTLTFWKGLFLPVRSEIFQNVWQIYQMLGNFGLKVLPPAASLSQFVHFQSRKFQMFSKIAERTAKTNIIIYNKIRVLTTNVGSDEHTAHFQPEQSDWKAFRCITG